MTQRTKKLLVLGVLVMVLGAACVIGGGFFYLHMRNQSWLNMAEEAYEAENWFEAKRYYRWYLPQDRENEDLLRKYAQASLNMVMNRQGNLRDAATAYQQILFYHPGQEDVQNAILDVYETLGSWPQLLYYAEQYLRKRPDDPKLLEHRALALDKLSRYQEAIDAYRLLLDKGVGDGTTYGRIARLMRESGREGMALDMLNEAILEDPDDGVLLAQRARYYATLEQYPQAGEDIQKALELNPTSAEVLKTAAQYAALRGDFDKVIVYLEKIHEDTTEVDLYTGLAQAYAITGQPDRAIDLLEGIDVMQRIDEPQIYITLADLLITAGRYEEAHEVTKEYLSVWPDHVPIGEYLEGRELLARGQAQAAAEVLSGVVEVRPDFAPARLYLAVAYMDSGQKELGRTELESYMRVNPDDPRAKQLLARQFGSSMTYEEVQQRATTFKDNEGLGAEPRIAAAIELFDQSLRRNAAEENLPTVRELLEGAIESNPLLPMPYKALADVYTLMGLADEARAVVQRGVHAGVEEKEFALSRTGLALAEGDLAAARNEYERMLKEPEVTAAEVASWASFFSARDHSDLGYELLDKAKTSLNERQGVQLEIARINLLTKDKRLDEAMQAVNAVASSVQGDSDSQSKLNDARIALARQLLALETPKAESEARQLIAKVREQQPDNAQASVVEADIIINGATPDLERARALYEKALNADPDNLSALTGMARVAASKGELFRAYNHLKRASELAPDIPGVQALLADVLIRLDRHAEAQQALLRILDVDPENRVINELLVTTYAATGDIENAKAALARLEAAAPDDAQGQARIATLRNRVQMLSGEAGTAERELRARYAGNPEDFSALDALVTTLVAQERIKEAEELMREYAQGNSDDPQAWVALGKFYLSLSRDESLADASTALTQALILDADYLPALREMIEVHMRRGNFLEARALSERFLEREPDDAQILYARALAMYQTRDNLSVALASIDHALSLDERAEYHAIRGIILMEMGQFGTALKDLQTAARTQTQLTARLDLALAEAYFETGSTDLAKQHFKSAADKVLQGDEVDQLRLRALERKLNAQL